MTEEFVLDIEGTGVIKHMTFNMVITWESTETEEKIDDQFVEALEYDSKPGGPVIVLQDGIKEWLEANMKHPVYGRCKSLEADETIGGPELLFGSEGDRAYFVLRWL